VRPTAMRPSATTRGAPCSEPLNAADLQDAPRGGKPNWALDGSIAQSPSDEIRCRCLQSGGCRQLEKGALPLRRLRATAIAVRPDANSASDAGSGTVVTISCLVPVKLLEKVKTPSVRFGLLNVVRAPPKAKLEPRPDCRAASATELSVMVTL